MFTGSLVALVTPMHSDGRVDYESLERLVEMHVDAGTDAIVSVGTTGESATLDFDEHSEVMRQTIAFVHGRMPVIAGTGANSTSEAIALTREAARLGADAALLVTPYYNKPPQEGLYQHYKALAEASDIPQILYNVPGRTGCDMLPETVGRLAVIPNIIGIKEATGDMDRIRQIQALCNEGFEIYSGDDATAREAILLGCNGDISVTANVAPRLMHEMCAAARLGYADAAAKADAQLAGLHETLFLDPNPIPVKWALWKMGLIQEGMRLPLVKMNAEFEERLTAAMTQAGVL